MKVGSNCCELLVLKSASLLLYFVLIYRDDIKLCMDFCQLHQKYCFRVFDFTMAPESFAPKFSQQFLLVCPAERKRRAEEGPQAAASNGARSDSNGGPAVSLLHLTVYHFLSNIYVEVIWHITWQ